MRFRFAASMDEFRNSEFAQLDMEADEQEEMYMHSNTGKHSKAPDHPLNPY